MEIKNKASEEPLIYELSIASTSQESMKGLLIFGEHPREMISPETGINIAKSLCLAGDQSTEIT